MIDVEPRIFAKRAARLSANKRRKTAVTTIEEDLVPVRAGQDFITVSGNRAKVAATPSEPAPQLIEMREPQAPRRFIQIRIASLSSLCSPFYCAGFSPARVPLLNLGAGSRA